MCGSLPRPLRGLPGFANHLVRTYVVQHHERARRVKGADGDPLAGVILLHPALKVLKVILSA